MCLVYRGYIIYSFFCSLGLYFMCELFICLVCINDVIVYYGLNIFFNL